MQKAQFKNISLKVLSFLIPVVFSFGIFTAHAAIVTWDGDAADNTWETATNWSGDTLPGAGDDVVIDTAGTVNIYGTTTINSLKIGETAATTLNFAYDAITDGALIIDDGNLNIYANGNITHSGASLGEVVNGKIYIDVQSGAATIVGNINVIKKGYKVADTGFNQYWGGEGPGAGGGAWQCGGGGYGGQGGSPIGATYGSALNPVSLGSSGGSGGNAGQQGGYGGGAVRIEVKKELNLTGSILANGGLPSGGDSGAGSGGAINIVAGSFTGSGGSISANGRNGGYRGGGGGRVSINASDYSYAGTLTVVGGSPGAGGGTINISNNFTQYQSDGSTELSVGEIYDAETPVLELTIEQAVSGDYIPEFEVREIGTSFSDSATDTGGSVNYSGSSVTASKTLAALSQGEYHWQARLCDASSPTDCTSWTSFGVNTESTADFEILLNTAPNAATALGPAGLVDGSYTGDNTPTLNFTISDPDDSDQVKYQIEIDDDSDFSSAVVDYTSAFDAEGERSFTVGQAAESGTYATGSEGQTLSGGNYYWRVTPTDDDSATGSTTTANSGSVAFIVDATAPSVPSSVTPSTTPVSDSTPTWSWTGSTDGGIGLASTPYTVQWCDNDSFTDCASNTDTSSTTSYIHTISLADGTWYFRVKAEDDAGNTSAYSTEGSAVIDTTAPTVPSGLAPDTTPTANNTPAWSWTASTDSGTSLAANPYTVQWCDNDGFTGCDSNTATTSSTLFTHPTALTDGTWYLRVKAVDTVNNESSYSSGVPVVIDTTSPNNFEIDEPDSKSYTNDERPEFSWTVDSTASTYKIEVENGDDDFEISGISATGSGEEKYNKYKLEYKDDKIFFETRSSSDWGDSDNDGELNEGEIEFTVTATDSSNNTAIKSQKFYVDKSGPAIEIENIDGDGFSDGDTIGNGSPEIKVKVIDELAGIDDKEVASGPASGTIILKREGILGIYTKVTSEDFDFDKVKWEDTGQEASDDDNDSNKYGTYTLSLDEDLESDDYKIEVSAEDVVGNESQEEFEFTVAYPVQIVVTQTPTPTAPVQEPTQEDQDQAEAEDQPQEQQDKNNYQVSVKVSDALGNPVRRALVSIEGIKTRTNRAGEVILEGIEEGRHLVSVNYKDYTGSEEVILGGDVERHNIEIQMQIEAGPQNPVINAISNIFNTIINTLFGWIPSIF